MHETTCAATASATTRSASIGRIDMRYAGQGYEITMPCTAEQTMALATLRKKFDAEHKNQFGHMAPDEPVEVVSYRVRGVGLVPPVSMPRFSPRG